MDHLQTEARNPASTRLDELTAEELVGLMNREDATVAAAVGVQSGRIARAVEVVADRLAKGGRLIYVGAGTSGRLGVLDASECPPTFQSPPGQVVGVIAGGHIALSGGSAPGPAYQLAAQNHPDWTGAHVWFGDDRVVPPSDSRSNYRLVRTTLLDSLSRSPSASG